MNIVIIGTGYVGLTSALGYTKLGHTVFCVDVLPEKIAELNAGRVPFFEEGLEDALREAMEKNTITFTTDLDAALPSAELVMFAVGTPPTETGEANLSYLFQAAEQVGELLDHEALLVIKSTVPVGTNKRVREIVRTAMKQKDDAQLAESIHIVSLPEFLREGTAFRDFLFPERIVVGADDSASSARIEKLHHGIETTWVRVSLETAELTKYAANAMLATKISFINEIANIAERVGADVKDIAHAIGLDSRIGPHFLNAGIGYGGSCFPKDVSALQQIAGSHGYDFKLLSAVIEVNNHQRDLFFEKIQAQLQGLKEKRLAVWGLAFKPGTDDIRMSASIDLVQRLSEAGAEVIVFDPQAMDASKKVLPDRVQFADTALAAAEGADALILLTEWPEFLQVDFGELKKMLKHPIIFDGRNFFPRQQIESHGFTYVGVGV